jgi:hypothetical protein
MAKRKPKGLGDTIEQFTEATGIKAGVEKLAEAIGWDCGCDKRKEALNQMFPYKKINCLNEEDYEYLNYWFSVDRHQVSILEQTKLREIYYNIFEERLEQTSCDSCWRDYISRIRKVYIEYKNNQDASTKM